MRAKPRVPKYGLHKPTGQARVVVGGRHVYLGRYGSPESRREYARLVAEHAAIGLATPLPTAAGRWPDVTVNELILRAVEHADAYYRGRDGEPTGEAQNIRHAAAVLRGLYGHTPAREFGPRGLAACQQRMIDQGLARNTVNARTKKIKPVFQWGVAWELVPPDVLTALRALPSLRAGRTAARETEPVQPVPDAAVEATHPRTRCLTTSRRRDSSSPSASFSSRRSKATWEARLSEPTKTIAGEAVCAWVGCSMRDGVPRACTHVSRRRLSVKEASTASST